MKMFQTQSQYRPGESPYELFKDRMSAISSIVGGIKGMILNKYNKGVMDSIIGQVEKARSEEEATDMINLLTTEPTDIYPDDEKLNTMAGQFVDYANLANRERKMGMPTGEMGQITRGELGLPATVPPLGTPPTSEVTLPKGDRMQFLNAIQGMPGETDFAPVLKYMQEHRPFFMGSMSPTEQWVMNQAMQGSPRDKMMEDMKAASLAYDFVNPQEKRPGKYPYDEKEVKEFEEWKASRKPDISKLIENISKNPDIELTNFNVSSTGTYSYSFKPKDTTTAWEFNTWEEAEAFAKAHPQKGFIPKIETNKQGFDVYWYQKGTGATGTSDKVTTAEISLVEKQFTGVKTNAQYNTALATVRQTDKNVICPTKEEIFTANYNKAKTAIMKTAIDVNTGGIREGDYKEGLSYIDVYKALYDDLITAIREYQLATGQLLENPFLSFEEYEKTDVKPRKILSSSTWGQQKSVFKDANSYITGETEKGIKGKEDEHGYIIGATYKNEEGKLLKYLGNNEWEEITSSEEGRTRGIK